MRNLRRRSTSTTILTLSVLLTACGAFTNTPPSNSSNSQVAKNLQGLGGLSGTYFAEPDFKGQQTTQRDGMVHFDWGDGSFSTSDLDGAFSAVWNGMIRSRYNETYTFTLRGQGAGTLTVDGRVIAQVGGRGEVKLDPARPHRIRIEYSGTSSKKALSLYWESQSQSRQLVPAQAMRPVLKSTAPSQIRNQWTVEPGAEPTLFNGFLQNPAFSSNTNNWQYEEYDPYDRYVVVSKKFTVESGGAGEPTRYAEVGPQRSVYASQGDYVVQPHWQRLPMDYVLPGAIYTLTASGRSTNGGVCTTGLETARIINNQEHGGITIPDSTLSFNSSNWEEKKISFVMPETVEGYDPYYGGRVEELALFFNSTTDPSKLCNFSNFNLSIAVPPKKRYQLDDSDFKVEGGNYVGDKVTYTAPEIAGAHYNWYFGDGTYITNQRTVERIFSASGEYEVEIEADIDGNREIDSYLNYFYKLKTIKNPSSPIIPPSISSPNLVATIGSATHFDGSDFEGDTYQWAFDDGTSAQGIVVDHLFAKPGKHTATLTVNAAGKATQTQKMSVIVLPEIQNIVKQRSSNESLSMEYDLGEPVDGLSYTIDFGDGSTSNTSKGKHEYTKIGTYDYTVTIRDTRQQITGQGLRSGLKAQATEAPVVYQQSSFFTSWRKAPEAQFSFVTNVGENINVANLGINPQTTQVTFDAQSSKDPNIELSNLSYKWDFGNGTTATTAQATATFSEQGLHLVTLKVTNQWGLSSTKRQFILVRHPASDWTLRAKLAGLTTASLSDNSDPEFDDLTKTVAVQGLEHTTSSGLQPQSIRAQASFEIKNTFPYVLSAANNVERGVHFPTADNGTRVEVFCDSYKLYKNNIESYPRYTQNPSITSFCSQMVMIPGNLGRFPASQSNFAQISSSRGLYKTNFNVFYTLSVPKVFISVVPDDFLPGDQSSPILKTNYITDEAGVKHYVMRVLFRQSEIQNGILEFNIPVLALDSKNQFLNELNGILNARFKSPYIPVSETQDGVLVNGRANIKVKVFANDFAIGEKELDLTQVQVFGGSTDCSSTVDSRPNSIASKSFLFGCDVVTTTTKLPDSTALADIPAFPKELQKSYTLGNHTFFGDQAKAAEAFKIYSLAGHKLAHTFVEYAAPFALLEERRNDLQKVIGELTVDGILSPPDAAKISLMSLDVWASSIPAGPTTDLCVTM